jgi:hypothetical protein
LAGRRGEAGASPVLGGIVRDDFVLTDRNIGEVQAQRQA